MTAPVQPDRPVSRRRWAGRLLFAVLVLGTTGGVLKVVIESNMAISRLTADVGAAQRRAAGLSTTQREALRMMQEITDLDRTADADAVEVRSGLLSRQLTVTSDSFPEDSAERRELLEGVNTLAAYPWGSLAARPDLRPVGLSLVSAIEERARKRYGQQEGYFYDTNLRALDAKAASERALIGLVILIAVLGTCWIVALKRRSRSDIALAYDALQVSEQRFRSLVQRASDLTAVTHLDGTVVYLSPAGEEILGRPPDERVEPSLLDRVLPEDRSRTDAMLAELAGRPSGVATVELRMLAADGRVRTLEAVCRNLVADPAVGGVVWNARDVTDRRALQDQLSHQAFHDSLTGLPNRALFMRRLDEALQQAAATGGSAAAILIDLDGFKNVNDTLGHPAGDELLQRAAERLRGCILDGDTVARLGGDEFAIVVPGGTAEHAVAISRRVITALRRSISAAGQEVRVGASIGVAHLAGHSTAVDLLADADIAMYAAKRSGKGRYRVFAPDMREATSRRTQIEQQLSRAVGLGQIEVHYQPIVALRSRRVVAVEALARWRPGDGSTVGPDVFIPIAEEIGLIEEIGAEVLRQASETVQRWRRTEPDSADLGVTVNVSGWQILAGDYALRLADSLSRSELPPEALTLEITESMLLDDSETLAAELQRIKALGVRLAMDDFGAGYSSLSSLLRVPVDTLKIDRMFLAHALAGQGSLVHAVAELGRTLRLTVVAEGVETADQLALVRAAGCDAIQGFLISKPLPEADARIFLEWAAGTDEIETLLSGAEPSSV